MTILAALTFTFPIESKYNLVKFADIINQLKSYNWAVLNYATIKTNITLWRTLQIEMFIHYQGPKGQNFMSTDPHLPT